MSEAAKERLIEAKAHLAKAYELLTQAYADMEPGPDTGIISATVKFTTNAGRGVSRLLNLKYGLPLPDKVKGAGKRLERSEPPGDRA